MKLIDKDALVAELEKRQKEEVSYDEDGSFASWADQNHYSTLESIKNLINTLEVKEVELNDIKPKWLPTEKQLESLKDMLKYNIGVFDYQKFMEVKSLYDELQNVFNFDIK